LPTALALAPRVRHPALRVPRTVGRVVDAAGRRIAGPASGRAGPGGGPSWQRLLGHGGAQRSVGCHIDGADADGGPDDGYTLGVDRPRHPSIYVAYAPGRVAGARDCARSPVRAGRRIRP